MSYVILGRAIKSEYLVLGTLFSTAAIAYSSMGGKKVEKLTTGKSLVDQAKDAVPINAGSSEEQELMNSIQKFIAEAEKDVKH